MRTSARRVASIHLLPSPTCRVWSWRAVRRYETAGGGQRYEREETVSATLVLPLLGAEQTRATVEGDPTILRLLA